MTDKKRRCEEALFAERARQRLSSSAAQPVPHNRDSDRRRKRISRETDQLWLDTSSRQAMQLHNKKSRRSESNTEHLTSAVQPVIFAFKPLLQTCKYYWDPQHNSRYVKIQRTQYPLIPAAAMPPHITQGTTADPGMVSYGLFPQICSPTLKWLIVSMNSGAEQSAGNDEPDTTIQYISMYHSKNYQSSEEHRRATEIMRKTTIPIQSSAWNDSGR